VKLAVVPVPNVYEFMYSKRSTKVSAEFSHAIDAS
jgi:hypothetical protein